MKIVALNNIKYKGKYRTPGTESAEFDCPKGEAEALIASGDAEMPRQPGQDTPTEKKAGDIIATANAEAKKIIETAEKKADEIVKAAEDKAAEIAGDGASGD